jgi:hypothetical protein
VLPDGIFSNQKSKLGSILEVLEMKDVGIFGAILSILRANGIFSGRLVHFVVIWAFPVLVCCTEKNLATLTLNAPLGRGSGSININVTSRVVRRFGGRE